MHVIQNSQSIVSGVQPNGVIQYVHGDQKPLLFNTAEEAATWWEQHAPTLPALGATETLRAIVWAGFLPRQIDEEARALYESYRAAKPTAVGGAVLPSWEDNTKLDVKDAWRATARDVLARHSGAMTVPIDPAVEGHAADLNLLCAVLQRGHLTPHADHLRLAGVDAWLSVVDGAWAFVPRPRVQIQKATVELLARGVPGGNTVLIDRRRYALVPRAVDGVVWAVLEPAVGGPSDPDPPELAPSS